jgi:hypothetical protein
MRKAASMSTHHCQFAIQFGIMETLPDLRKEDVDDFVFWIALFFIVVFLLYLCQKSKSLAADYSVCVFRNLIWINFIWIESNIITFIIINKRVQRRTYGG